MLTATVSHHFSAGHRIRGLVGPGAKCANIHGHTFGVHWTLELPDLNAAQLEFANVKHLFRGWVDAHLDHGFIADAADSVLVNTLADWNSKLHVLDGPPTTERIATLIAEKCQAILPGVKLLEVKVTEGPHNAATWTYEDPAPYGLPGFNPYVGLVDE